jgi:hypothetical protein
VAQKQKAVAKNKRSSSGFKQKSADGGFSAVNVDTTPSPAPPIRSGAREGQAGAAPRRSHHQGRRQRHADLRHRVE